jgi:hypothetical protein
MNDFKTRVPARQHVRTNGGGAGVSEPLDLEAIEAEGDLSLAAYLKRYPPTGRFPREDVKPYEPKE